MWTPSFCERCAETVADCDECFPDQFGESGKFLTTNGTTMSWGDATPTGSSQMFLSAAGMWPSLTNGMNSNLQVESATNKQNVYFLDAPDSGSKKYCEANLAMPSDWDLGTITAKFYWACTSTSANDVVWGLQGVALADTDTIDATWGTAQEVVDTNNATANKVLISSATSAITIANTPASNDLVLFRAYRDSANGSDTLAATARLLGIIITYGRV